LPRLQHESGTLNSGQGSARALHDRGERAQPARREHAICKAAVSLDRVKHGEPLRRSHGRHEEAPQVRPARRPLDVRGHRQIRRHQAQCRQLGRLRRKQDCECATHRYPDYADPVTISAQLGIVRSRRDKGIVGRDTGKIGEPATVAGQQWRHDVKTGGVQAISQVTERLWRVSGAVEQQDGRRGRPGHHEALATDDDAVRPEAPVTQRECLHRTYVSRAQEPSRRSEQHECSEPHTVSRRRRESSVSRFALVMEDYRMVIEASNITLGSAPATNPSGR
jgi:hypothetical protein